ncbi:MAG: sugar ABC transporter permease [Caldilineaceae bacterium]
MILPTILVLLAIQVYPAVYTIWLSVQERNPDGWTYVGGRNFQRLFNMSVFSESVGHTVVFLVGYAALTLVLGFIIALLLNRKVRLSGLYITILFIPWIIADIIAGLVFRLLVLPDYGLFAGVLQNATLFPPDGLSVLTCGAAPPVGRGLPLPPAPAMTYLILASVWRALPFITLLLLAAMQTVSEEVIDSSRIDGRAVADRAPHRPAHAAHAGGGALQPHAQRHERRDSLHAHRRRAGHLHRSAQLPALLHRLAAA